MTHKFYLQEMDVLNQYPAEYAKSLKYCLTMLSWNHIKFFSEDQSLKKNWKFFVFFFGFVLFTVSVAIGICVELVDKEKLNSNTFDLLFRVTIVLLVKQAILKAYFLVLNIPKLSYVMRELGTLWSRPNLTPTQHKEKNALLKKIHISNIVTYWFDIFGTLQYLLLPLLEMLVRRLILEEDCEMLLPIICSYPLTPNNNWIRYIIVYAFIFFSFNFSMYIFVGVDLLIMTLCADVTVQFNILREDILTFKPLPSKERGTMTADDKAFRELIVRHQKLIELSALLNDAFNVIIFVILIFVGITLCLLTYLAQLSRNLADRLNSYLPLFVCGQFIFYICYYGELLTGSSASIGDAAYNSLWYQGGTSYKKSIILIIQRSQRPCCLTSLKYAQVSLNMFTKVMSTTWSYLSLMNSVYGEEE